jgi:DNA-binding transcriptional LysR family regulator
MDYVIAKTFLSICKTGTFGASAIEMNVTQTTITARIKSLENELKCSLFIRNKSGAKLTKNGQHFKSYAIQMVHTWDAAKRDLPLPINAKDSIAIGVDLTLWNPIAASWLVQINEATPELAVNIEVGASKELCEKVRTGGLDIALVHQPEYSSHIIVEHLLDEKLVRVQAKNKSEPYLFVDWGAEYRRLHDTALPELARSNLSISLGPAALQVILKAGGSGYFRTRVVNRYLEQGILTLTPNSPQFSYPVYLICYAKKDIDMTVIKQQLLNVFNESGDWF